MKDNVLEVNNLYGGYGKSEILHGIDLHVGNNEIVCIIGPNGSGKSTAIKVIYGLATYHSGEVLFKSPRTGEIIDITKYKANDLVPLGIAYVPQRDNVFPALTIEENLEMGGYTLAKESLDEALNNVYETYPILKERREYKAKTLSGGQRQLLALGRALIIDPELIILDEPSAALQPSLVMEIMERIRRLRDEFDKTVLIVEQNTKSALAITDRGYILAAGQLIHTDTGHELLHNTDLGGFYMGSTKSDTIPSKNGS